MWFWPTSVQFSGTASTLELHSSTREFLDITSCSSGVSYCRSSFWFCLEGVCMLSRVQLFATLWTAACQAPLVHGILQARVLEWVAISYCRDLPHPGIETVPPALACRFFTTEPPGKPLGVESPRKWKKESEVAQSCLTLQPCGL